MFQKPLPLNISETLKIRAKNWKKKCIEAGLFGSSVDSIPLSQDEDCLYLNIFTQVRLNFQFSKNVEYRYLVFVSQLCFRFTTLLFLIGSTFMLFHALLHHFSVVHIFQKTLLSRMKTAPSYDLC